MVNVLTVTYGNRWKYLEQVLKKLISIPEVTQIVVVNNGSSYNIKDAIINLLTDKIYLINFSTNSGSAFGFKAGLEYISKGESVEFIWLLDDDNLPAADCLNNLLLYWTSDKQEGKNTRQALLALRINRDYLMNIAKAHPMEFNFPTGNAFLGFNILRLPAHVNYLISKRLSRTDHCQKRETEIPFAPYGGLFMHKDLIKIIGYPDIRFLLYADDFEFTNRIRIAGGKIILLSNCKINDLEAVWFSKTKKPMFKSRYLEQNDFRAYYSVRNSIYFSLHFLVTSKLLFTINSMIYSSAIFLLAIISLKYKRYFLFRKAIKAGFEADFENKILLPSC